jgi:GTPase SAR1 family protein
MYCGWAAGALIVYGVSIPLTFHSLRHRVQEIRENAGHDIFLTIVGNKCDLLDRRIVFTEEGMAFARIENAVFTETSD